MLQGMIFISDPYYNEPAYEGMRGTEEGMTSSLKYNSGEAPGWVGAGQAQSAVQSVLGSACSTALRAAC